MRITFFMLLSAASLGGCMVGPSYRAPRISAPATFMGDSPLAQRSGRDVDLSAWWRAFDDPILSMLVDRTTAQNLDIAQAIERVGQSRSALRSVVAALRPSIGVASRATAARQSAEAPQGLLFQALGRGRDIELYESDLEAGWEIDLFGGLSRRREAARADYAGSLAGLDAMRLAVVAQTADTYVVIRGLQSRIAIAREQATMQRRLVDIVELQYRKGIAAELQFRQAQGALSQAEAAIPQLDVALETAQNALDVLLGAQPGTYRALLSERRPVPIAPAISSAGGPAALIRRRPDLIAAERRLAASNARIGAAISEYFPKFSLSGLIGTSTLRADRLFASSAGQASGVMGLRWRLFDFGRVDAEIAAARGAHAEALAAYRLAVLRASEDVENSFAGVVRQEAREQALAAGEKALARARQSSLAAYQGGVSSLIDVIDADRRLLETRDARVQAATEAARSAIAAFRALGGGRDAGRLVPVAQTN